MRRQMVRFLQKRKFRLVTRWKLALKDDAGFQLPAHHPFPFTLTFRAFDEIVRALKDEDGNTDDPKFPSSILRGLGDDEAPTADQYMELFLSGRDVLGEFIDHDPSFAARFDTASRHDLHVACERVMRHLIEREMREYSRRFTSRATREPATHLRNRTNRP